MSVEKTQLDDVMMAMDVVDTLRHSSRLIERELDTDSQDARLLDRLRNIYTTQGIEVPDHILQEGVDALREDRFTYVPTPPSLSRKLAKIYITRHEWGRGMLGIIGAILISALSYHTFWAWPQARMNAQIERELTEIFPQQFEQLSQRIDTLTDDTTIEARADGLVLSGTAALQSKDIEAARNDIAALEDISTKLMAEYDLRIVTGLNQDSGVWRIPDDNPNARNYYLIVEPVSKDGKVLSIDVLNEENNKTVNVNKFGVRVPEAVFENMRRDKQDDGIIKNKIIGAKNRGALEATYSIQTLNGIITEW